MDDENLHAEVTDRRTTWKKKNSLLEEEVRSYFHWMYDALSKEKNGSYSWDDGRNLFRKKMDIHDQEHLDICFMGRRRDVAEDYQQVAAQMKNQFQEHFLDIVPVKDTEGNRYIFCTTTAQRHCLNLLLDVHIEYPQLNVCVRHHAFQDENFELSFSVPENWHCPTVHSLPAAATLNEHEYNPEVIQAICYGPHFTTNGWHDQQVAMWIFSRWRGFVDIDFCFPTEAGPIHVFQYRRVDLSFETLWEKEDEEKEDSNLFSGLQLVFKRSKDPKSLVSQSIGAPATLESADGTRLLGFFTTMHSVNKAYLPLQDNDIGKVFVSDDSSGNRRLVDIGKCVVPGSYGDLLLVPGQPIQIEVDCVFVRCGGGVEEGANPKETRKMMSEVGCSVVNERFELTPLCLDQTPTLSSTLETNFGKVYKSGYKTGCTMGIHISSLAVYRLLKTEKLKSVDKNFPHYTASQSLPTVEGNTYMLIHDPDGKFASHGDSGGLVWYFKQHQAIPIGMLIGQIDPHLYIVLPLAFIQYVFEAKGYKVHWSL